MASRASPSSSTDRSGRRFLTRRDSASAAAEARRRWATASAIASLPMATGMPHASCALCVFVGPWGRRRPQACSAVMIKLNQPLLEGSLAVRTTASVRRMGRWRATDPWNSSQPIRPVIPAKISSAAGNSPPHADNRLRQHTVFVWRPQGTDREPVAAPGPADRSRGGAQVHDVARRLPQVTSPRRRDAMAGPSAMIRRPVGRAGWRRPSSRSVALLPHATPETGRHVPAFGHRTENRACDTPIDQVSCGDGARVIRLTQGVHPPDACPGARTPARTRGGLLRRRRRR